jgi:hypothetical protein
MVHNLKLCSGECYKGANCNTAGYDMAVYVVRKHLEDAHEGGVRSGDIFLSLDLSKNPPAFGAMVLGIPGDSSYPIREVA